MRRDLIGITRVTPEIVEAGLPSIAPDVFDDDPTSESISSFVSRPGHLLIVAIEGPGYVVGQCAGHVLADASGATTLYIDNVGVSPLHQRRGIASRLVTDMLRWASEFECRDAWLVTEPDNVAAIELYRSLGGTEFSTTMFELSTSEPEGIRPNRYLHP